jgi:uncharacterized membrane protein YebE (DUF533 family)
MIDINQLLTQVMGGTLGSPDLHQDPTHTGRNIKTRSSERSPPTHPAQWRLETRRLDAQSGPIGGRAGAFGTGALAGGLAGLLFGSKRMREAAGTAVQIGAVAAIGGLAYKAYQNYRQGKPVVPQSIKDIFAGQSFGAPQPSAIKAWIPPNDQSDVSTLLLRTMVAAAAADGHLDGMEYNRLKQQLAASGLNEEEQLFLSQMILRPATISDLAAEATTPELRAEVYTAARIAMEPDTAKEQKWLDQLSAALKLEPELRAHLDSIGDPRQEQAA